LKLDDNRMTCLLPLVDNEMTCLLKLEDNYLYWFEDF
jgi:hypothetical protein